MANLNEQQILTQELIQASIAYYNTGSPLMSDAEFDQKSKRLAELEAASNTVLSGSPTMTVGAEVVTALKKAKHEEPALSLDKINLSEINAIQKLKDFIGDEKVICDWKLDGLTVVVTYENGKLISAVTRGDGITGSVITHNAKYFKGLPIKIDYPGKLIVRGEATMKQSEFERVNALSGGIYENARNLASATIQMLDSRESRKREIYFNAFELVVPEVNETAFKSKQMLDLRYMSNRFKMLRYLDFNTVYYECITADQLEDTIAKYKTWLKTDPMDCRNDMPTDGLVFTYEDQMCSRSRFRTGDTGHHPHGWLAMKWTDEQFDTVIQNIEWQVGRTGIVTPVAVFNDTRMGLGSTVNHATLHNISIMQQKNIHVHAKAKVYMANMIIPEVYSCENGDPVQIPDICPVCGSKLVRMNDMLKCTNTNCAAQKIGKFTHFCEKDCMNIDGMSAKTIDKLINMGYLKTFDDLYKLSQYELIIKNQPGFGSKATKNMLDSIDASRNANFIGFIHAMGIPDVGKGQAKLLYQHFNADINAFLSCHGTNYDFTVINGFGDIINQSLHEWFSMYYDTDDGKTFKNANHEIIDLLACITFPKISNTNKSQVLAGKTFVITGSVENFDNREAFEDFIEEHGGKTSKSVSTRTDFLINNDVNSTSSKNQKAKSLGVPIISENEFLAML